MWTVDGANNNDVGSNRTILIYPSVEAIEEFKIQRNSYGAEFGQAAGAPDQHRHPRRHERVPRQRLLLRPQRRARHRPTISSSRRTSPRTTLSRHDFGWNLGGPIIKDKLHFFASQEWNSEKRGTVRAAFVPTAAERAGDFSGPESPAARQPAPNDPLTGAPFAGQPDPGESAEPRRPALPAALSAAEHDAGSRQLQQLGGLAQRRPSTGARRTSASTGRSATRRASWLRYTQDSWTNDAPERHSANLWGDDPFPAVDSNWDQPAKSLMLQLNHNVGSKGVNTSRSPTRPTRSSSTAAGRPPGLNAQILAAIPSVYPLSEKQYGDDTGHPVFWGGGGYSTLWNEAPVPKQPGPLRPEGRLLGGLRQAPLQGGLPRQHEREERGLARQRLAAELGVLGLGRPQRLGRHDRQHARRLPAQGHDVGLLRGHRLPPDRRRAGRTSSSTSTTRGSSARA